MQIQAEHMIRNRKIKRSQRRIITDQRRIRVIQVKDTMKQAVRMAKAAGKAIEYRGPLNRANIVSVSIFSKIKILTEEMYKLSYCNLDRIRK